MSRFPPPARIPRVRKRIAARPAVFPGPVGRAGIATLPGARTGDCPASFRLLNSAADRSVSGPARSRSSTSQHAGGNLRVFTRGYALLLLLTLIALFLAAPRPLTPAPLAGGAVIRRSSWPSDWPQPPASKGARHFWRAWEAPPGHRRPRLCAAWASLS